MHFFSSYGLQYRSKTGPWLIEASLRKIALHARGGSSEYVRIGDHQLTLPCFHVGVLTSEIQCDLRLAGCGQCRRAKLVCHGFRVSIELAFRDETHATKQKVLARQDFHPFEEAI